MKRFRSVNGALCTGLLVAVVLGGPQAVRAQDWGSVEGQFLFDGESPDLPALIAYAADLEQESLRRFQNWAVGPDGVLLARRGASWRHVARALVAKAQAADVASIATVLGDVRAELEAVDQDS